MKGIEKFKDEYPQSVETEMLIHEGHRYKTFGLWDSRTAKGDSTNLSKVLERAEKIFENEYVRPDQRKSHLKKITFAVAQTQSCIIKQLESFMCDLQYLVQQAQQPNRLSDDDVYCAIRYARSVLDEHQLWRSPNN